MALTGKQIIEHSFKLLNEFDKRYIKEHITKITHEEGLRVYEELFQNTEVGDFELSTRPLIEMGAICYEQGDILLDGLNEKGFQGWGKKRKNHEDLFCKGGCGEIAKYKNGYCHEVWQQCPVKRQQNSKRLLLRNRQIQQSFPYEQKNYPARKEILWKEQGCKCKNCGYNLYDYINGPYQIHHIDGNMNNHKRENEILLCCNCHYMTDNYGFRGRNHTRKTKDIIAKKRNGVECLNIYQKDKLNK